MMSGKSDQLSPHATNHNEEDHWFGVAAVLLRRTFLRLLDRSVPVGCVRLVPLLRSIRC